MTPYELIDLLIIACSALLIWAVVATLSLFRERKEGKPKATPANDEENVTTTEIPVNDKDWHIRTDDVERIRAGIVENLRTYPTCIVTLDKRNKDSAISHGEACALLLPFLKKGYYAYRELAGWTGDKVTRFRVTKHRDAEPNALEITEELLTKNVQL